MKQDRVSVVLFLQSPYPRIIPLFERKNNCNRFCNTSHQGLLDAFILLFEEFKVN